MQPNPKILQSSDLEQILELERKANRSRHVDEMEADMAEWHSPWRTESLQYYLPLGWSFGLWQGSGLVAYFIAQPQLFINGMTQSLWLEHLFYSDSEHGRTLIEISYRLCREKHFQSLLFKNPDWGALFSPGISVQKWPESVYHVKTAKF